MSAREFLVLLMICTIWGLHFPVMKSVISAGIPPLAYAAIRMGLVAVMMSPWLRWHKGRMRPLLLAGLCFGALNYAFMFPAMGLTTASAGAVAIELYVPFSIILGIIFLGDRPGLRKLAGIALALAGVMIIASGKPDAGVAPNHVLGLILIACGAMSEAVGAIFVKALKGISPAQLLAWFGVVGALILAPLSFILEPNGYATAFSRPGLLALALLYTVGLVSILAHGSYYWLLQRLPISTVAPSGLMTTVIGVLGAVVFLREAFTLPLAIGMALVLSGVATVLWRHPRPASHDLAPDT